MLVMFFLSRKLRVRFLRILDRARNETSLRRGGQEDSDFSIVARGLILDAIEAV